jgi:CotH kinase protein
MMQKYYSKAISSIIVLIFSTNLYSQTFSSSNLPIIVINTGGKTIPDEPKINATMRIIYNAKNIVNKLTDTINDYDGNIGIEQRGSTSRTVFPKTPYTIELRDNAGNDLSKSILGMPKESDWNLIASYNDKTFLRDPFAYTLAGSIMKYAPRFRFVDVVIDKVYRGTYILVEKIKQDKNRVDISKLDSNDIAGDTLTGGYIIKVDKTDGGNNFGWQSNYTVNGRNPLFQYHYPEYDKMKPQQRDYIRNWMNRVESELYVTPDINDSLNGYRRYFDEKSFMDFVIVNEVCKNVDGYRLSTFMYKDRDSKNPKLQFGPVWDFNISQGNADYCQGELFTGWSINFNDVCSTDFFQIPFWFPKIWNDKGFKIRFKKHWFDARKSIISDSRVITVIDSMRTIVEEPLKQNFKVWPVLGVPIWPNKFVGNTYDSEIDYYKTWILNRLRWMDSEIKIFDVEPFIGIKVGPNPTEYNTKLSFFSKYSYNINLLVHDNLGRLVESKDVLTTVGENIITVGDNYIPGTYHFVFIIGQNIEYKGSFIKIL